MYTASRATAAFMRELGRPSIRVSAVQGGDNGSRPFVATAVVVVLQNSRHRIPLGQAPFRDFPFHTRL
jgi:hypothetical protein